MEKFLAAVRNMFNVPDLRRRIFFTLGLLAVYRFGAHVGAPGINKLRLEEVWRDVAFLQHEAAFSGIAQPAATHTMRMLLYLPASMELSSAA